MAKLKAVNPFYVAILPVGVIFAITACAYCVLVVRSRDPHFTADAGLMRLMNERGLVILCVELAVLSLLTVAAIGTDKFWEKDRSS